MHNGALSHTPSLRLNVSTSSNCNYALSYYIYFVTVLQNVQQSLAVICQKYNPAMIILYDVSIIKYTNIVENFLNI